MKKYQVNIATTYVVEEEDEKDAEDKALKEFMHDLNSYNRGDIKLKDVFGFSTEELNG